MLLSNKAILPILWEMFTGDPNLLPAAFARDKLPGRCVEKPVHGREGAEVRLLEAGEPGIGKDDRIYQDGLPATGVRRHARGDRVVDYRREGRRHRVARGCEPGDHQRQPLRAALFHLTTAENDAQDRIDKAGGRRVNC